MTLLGGWLLVPLVLALLAAGWGLLADAACGRSLPGALLPGVGLSAMICACGLVVLVDPIAPAAIPLAAIGALAGLFVGRERLRTLARAASPWPLLAGLLALAIYALPVLYDGGGMLAGYGRLDDTATWLGLTDQILHRGRDLASLPIGTYSRVLKDYLGQGYPVGSLLPLGLGAKLSGQDLANAYAPTIAVYGAVMTCSLYACARSIVRSRPAAALAALIAAQASLIFGYAQWGGIKEVATAMLLATFAPLGARALERGRARDALAGLLVIGALLGALGVDGAPWVGLGGLVLLAGRLRDRPLDLRVLGGLTALAIVIALPALWAARDLLSTALIHSNAAAASDQLGRLIAPLRWLQGAGLWPQDDFRLPPPHDFLQTLIAVVCLMGGVWGAVIAVRTRQWTLPILLGVTLVAAAVIAHQGVAWIDAKALAVSSPVVLVTGAAALMRHAGDERNRVAAAVAAVLVAVTAYSTGAVAHTTPSGPRAELTELADIGRDFAGKGPLLALTNNVYATRHFLRDTAPEGASERRDRYVYLRDGSLAGDYTDVTIDQVAANQLTPYRLISRRVGSAGTMPSSFRKVFSGRYWELWERVSA